MNKKIALFQSNDVFFSDDDFLKYLVVPCSTDVFGFTRITDWVEVEFKERPEHELKEIRIKSWLDEISKNEKNQAELIHNLNEARK